MRIRPALACFAPILLSFPAVAQRPSLTIDPQQHGDLAAAQQSVIQAYSQITAAQRANDSHLGGHAQRAKELLDQANQELQLAANQADANMQQMPPDSQNPPVSSAPQTAPASDTPQVSSNIAGSWTIYAYNTGQPGSSLKMVSISQNGNVLSGTFHGPHQHGKLQGWINGNHVEFSTDTHNVLTFRGEVTPGGMSGQYEFQGQNAPWRAERTN